MAGYDDFSTPVDAGIRPAAYVDASALGIKPAIPADAKSNPYDAISSPASAPAKTLREKYKEQLAAGKYEDGHNTPDVFTRVTDVIADPFGVRDQVRGGGAYLGKIISGQGSEAANKAYNEEVERARAENEYTRENMTRAGRIGADIVGGFGTTGAGKALATASSTFLSRAGKSAKAGAQFGFLSGAGHTEGDIVDRLGGGAEGAAWGAALGPALSEVAVPGALALYRGATNAPNAIGNALRNVIPGTRENIDQRLLTTLRRQDMTPQEALAQYDAGQAAARFGKTQTPLPETVADSGPAAQRLAYSVKASPGQGSTEAEQFLNDRARGTVAMPANAATGAPAVPAEPGTFGRVNDFLRRSLQVTNDNYAATEAKLIEQQKQLSNAAYAKAYANPSKINVDDILEASRAGDINRAQPMQAALDDARKLFTGDVNIAPSVYDPKLKARTLDLSAERFDSAKKALDDKIQVAINRGRNNEARELTGFKNDLIARADQAIPEYKAARDIFGDRAQHLDALAAGRKFASGDSEALGNQYKDYSTGEKRMFRIGMARQMQKDLGSKATGANLASYFDKPNMQDALSEIMTGPKYKQFQELLAREGKMAGTRQRVLGNSATAERQQDLMDFSLATRLGRQLKSGNILGAAGDAIASTVAHVYRYREQDARLLARELFNPDPNAVRATYTRLAQKYGQQTASQSVNTALQIAGQWAGANPATALGRMQARYGTGKTPPRAAANTQVPWITNSLISPSDPKRSNALANGR